jgi:hypothetical protein
MPPTLPIVLSEWSDLNPNNANRMLHLANDYPAIKGSTQSYYAEAKCLVILNQITMIGSE